MIICEEFILCFTNSLHLPDFAQHNDTDDETPNEDESVNETNPVCINDDEGK